MPVKDKDIITQRLGVEPIYIDAVKVSAARLADVITVYVVAFIENELVAVLAVLLFCIQFILLSCIRRQRYYWTNIKRDAPFIPNPQHANDFLSQGIKTYNEQSRLTPLKPHFFSFFRSQINSAILELHYHWQYYSEIPK